MLNLLAITLKKDQEKMTGQTGNDGAKNGKIMIPLKYLSNFWRTLINCETKLILTWPEDCVLTSNAALNQAVMFIIIDTKTNIPVVTLSTQDNAKLLQQLKSTFRRTKLDK